jgi:hypothetical protein
MAEVETKSRPKIQPVAFDGIARRIGRQLRDLYPHPEAEPIPTEHVQMLLQLRQRERSRRDR